MIRSVLFDGRESPSTVAVEHARDVDERQGLSYVTVKVGVDVNAIQPQTCVKLVLTDEQAESLWLQLGRIYPRGKR